MFFTFNDVFRYFFQMRIDKFTNGGIYFLGNVTRVKTNFLPQEEKFFLVGDIFSMTPPIHFSLKNCSRQRRLSQRNSALKKNVLVPPTFPLIDRDMCSHLINRWYQVILINKILSNHDLYFINNCVKSGVTDQVSV